MRERAPGVIATVRVERVIRGHLFRPEVDCLLGQEWWRVPVREGETYTFRLARRMGGVPHSYVTLPWPEGINAVDLADGRPDGTPAVDRERLQILLLRIRSGEITPEVEAEFLRAGRASLPGILVALREGDDLAKWNAARLLTLIPTAEATPDLASLADHPDPKLRTAAASALRETRTPEAREALAGFLGDPSPGVRSLAADGIGRHRAPEGLESIVPLLDDPDADVLRDAVRALGRIGGPRAAEAITGLLEAPDCAGGLRREALDALGRSGAREAIPALEKEIATGETGLVGEAVRALGRLGATGIPSLIRALESDDAYVRWRSAATLRSLTAKGFGYRHDAPAGERSAAVDLWRGWWGREGKRGLKNGSGSARSAGRRGAP